MSYESDAQRSAGVSVTELRDPATFPPAAVVMFERTLEEFGRLYGRDHPRTVEVRRELAVVLQGRGRVDEALQLLSEVLRQHERRLGESAPDTLAARYELALALSVAGRPGRAKTVLADAAGQLERALGADHVLAVASRELLADLQRSESE